MSSSSQKKKEKRIFTRGLEAPRIRSLLGGLHARAFARAPSPNAAAAGDFRRKRARAAILRQALADTLVVAVNAPVLAAAALEVVQLRRGAAALLEMMRRFGLRPRRGRGSCGSEGGEEGKDDLRLHSGTVFIDDPRGKGRRGVRKG